MFSTFRYRQLDVIEPALHNLDENQQLHGSQLLIEYLTNNTLTIQEEEFIERLTDIGMYSPINSLKSRDEFLKSNYQRKGSSCKNYSS